MRLRALMIVSLCTLALALTACGPKPEPKVVVVPPKEATAAAVGATVTGPEFPDGFPADIPLWPGSVVSNPQRANVGGRLEFSFGLATKDKYADVVDGMLRGVEKAGGWEIVTQTDLSTPEAKAGMIEFKKGEVDVVCTFAEKPEGGSTIAYVVTMPSK